jgi:hypothetical protein
MAEKPSPTVSESVSQESISETFPSKQRYKEGDAYVGGGAVELYEPIAEYEGRHRYDPSAEWTESEEKKLVRRVSSGSCITTLK